MDTGLHGSPTWLGLNRKVTSRAARTSLVLSVDAMVRVIDVVARVGEGHARRVWAAKAKVSCGLSCSSRRGPCGTWARDIVLAPGAEAQLGDRP